ncbi:hypothetical protein [Bacillus solimangrovi]|uniref:Uncharacterized protein n=1 Tax=Bacillus solimangrovi TaxID=1305675 RepID=A0A1E5LH24_9BACI|nr:hypothetical protein [Bacillus solimangrovi]OEH93381.1 hypothetical protein BFG57_12065 [Bacillus solimangrovi]
MSYKSLIDEIKRKDLDIEKIAEWLIQDSDRRNEVVKQLMTNKDIMVYYHSYYVLSRASEINPQLFYVYWDDFVALLSDNNSYKRDIGMTLIANLIVVDTDRKFDNIFEKYISLINDVKFMTAQCCVKNLKKIVNQREDMITGVVEILLQIDDVVSYPEKQKELLKYDVLDVLQSVYNKVDSKSEITLFIKNCLGSISPKTKKMAKKMERKYS